MNLVLVRPGSPPHVRGKEEKAMSKATEMGITPACAGKRPEHSAPASAQRDHPRMCGEKSGYSGLRAWVRGSPPHVRGKGWQERSTTANRRITPACAGKRRWPGCSGGSAGDHPRVCGEKSHQRGLGLLLLGSPPHVRGKGVRYLCIVLFAGITPACAGKRSGPLPAAVPAGLAGSCPASRPSQFPPRMTVISPRP